MTKRKTRKERYTLPLNEYQKIVEIKFKSPKIKTLPKNESGELLFQCELCGNKYWDQRGSHIIFVPHPHKKTRNGNIKVMKMFRKMCPSCVEQAKKIGMSPSWTKKL